MADNLKYTEAPIRIAVASGVSSGDPVCIGNMPGVALIDRDDDGYSQVDFRDRVWDLEVNAVDDAGNVAVAIGDDLYYTSGDSILLSKKASGVRFGTALEAINSGSSDTIMVKIDGASARNTVMHAKAYAKLDLSASAQSGVPILHPTEQCRLMRARLLYTEAPSTHTGVTVTIGNETNAAKYYTGTSSTTASQWTETAITLLASNVAAGDTVVCGTAGGKTGAGEILVCIEYVIV